LILKRARKVELIGWIGFRKDNLWLPH